MTVFGSIKQRLIAMHLVAIVVVAVALPLVLYWRVDVTARSLHDGAMLGQARQIAAYLHRTPSGGWEFDLPTRLYQLYSVNYDRYGFAILTASGQILFSGLGTGGKPVRHRATPGSTELLRTQPGPRAAVRRQRAGADRGHGGVGAGLGG